MQVIVPVYNAFSATVACLHALERCLPAGWTVQVVDDASTDKRISTYLGERKRLQRAGWEFRGHSRNQGFVRTVNASMARTTEDVVLLNSDTVPTEGCFQALENCLKSAPDIVTATPFSNNAEICSLPDFCRVNPPPAQPDALAKTLARHYTPSYPEIPTAVGFCMAIRRSGIDAIGDFDAEAFGRGYGEENDFCCRAVAAGYRNVLCDNAYVVHLGNASFADVDERPGPETLKRVLAKHPDYEKIVAEFIATDSLQVVRRQVLAVLTEYGIALEGASGC